MSSVKNLFLSVLLVAFAFVFASSVLAAPLTSVTDTPSSLVADATANHTITFTSATAASVKSVDIAFPAGFNIASATLGTYTPVNGEASPVLSVTRQVATITFGTASAAATATYTIVLNGVVNTTISGNASVTVTTKDASSVTIDGPTASANFLIQPAAISNLTCEPSGQAGAVWLRWTTPVGTSAGYEVKYQQGNSITYDTAPTFTQNWPSGTVGTAQQQLLTGLNPNTQYTFAMKALGGDSSISAVSTLTPSCYAPSSAKAVIDTQAPVTQITFPAMNSTVPVNEPLVIKGSSMDKGGSSVQMVEVSLDNGTTWNKADITLADDGNRIWQYTWARPSAGDQKVLVRASDWMGNVESPVSVTFTVGTVASTGTTPAPSTTPPTAEGTTPTSSGLPYANPVGEEQVRANLAYLQEQLLALLQQLLALLQAQLTQR